MLLRSGIDPAGKHAVVCGRSNLVGKPLVGLLMQKRAGGNATVTVCHTGTPDLAEHTRQRGHPDRRRWVSRGTITADMVREGAVVIDVGVNAIPDASKKAASASSAMWTTPPWPRRPRPSRPSPAASAR